MIKAIIFDVFGVLVGKDFWQIYAIAGGDPVKDAAFIEEMLDKNNGGLITGAEFQEAIARRLNLDIDTFNQIVSREEQPNQPLFDFIAQHLKPKYKIAIISNANAGVIERRIPAELRQLFDAIVVSGDVGVQKPDRRIFELAARRLGVGLDELIFVDDLERYTKPAQKMGIRSILYNDFDSFKQQLAEALS